MILDLEELNSLINHVQTNWLAPLNTETMMMAWVLIYIYSLTEVCFEEALNHATHLDDHLAECQKPTGPLHGVPTTLKDQFNVKGYDSTIGYVGRAFSPAKEDSVLVKMLRSLGAVIMAKSNLPQSISKQPLGFSSNDHGACSENETMLIL